MKKILLTFFLLLTLFLLSSCAECEHKYSSATCTQASTCTLCGKTSGTAIGHNWMSATCSKPKTCFACGATEGDHGEHSWSTLACEKTPICVLCGIIGTENQHTWVDATCTYPKNCPACGLTDGVELGHEWVQSTCDQPLSCTRCTEQTTEGIMHNWVFNGCTELRTCGDCDAVEAEAPGHSFVEATCTVPTHCSVCKMGKGKPLGHDWIEATCIVAKHCSRCALEDGVVTGHTFTFLEEIEPSCSVGRTIYECFCGEQQITTKPATIFYHICNEAGLCTVCNESFDVSLMTLEEIFIDSNSSYTLRCGLFSTTETFSTIYKPITADDVGIPVVDISGNLSTVGTNNYTTLRFSYYDGEQEIECYAEMRIQGASSAGYAKKNYSIKLYNSDGSKNKVELDDDWGKEFKYCMKANWIDYSQARNVVSAQLFGDVIRSRDVEDELTDLPNGGAIDGFPIIVFNNGVFHGLYTMNIPKDKWMFDMKDSDEKNQAIVMADQWGNSVAMREPISYNANNPNWTYSSYWELEYASNEDSLVDNSTLWVAESLNRLINFVINNNGEDFKNGISQYADVDKCIDSLIYTFFICADDNVSKNILWVTYDGTHWFSSVYDMDGTWGMQWNGNLSYVDGNTHLINALGNCNNTRYNLLWEKLYLNFYDEIVERYWEMRQDALSIENITARFESFFASIPDVVRTAEKKKWPGAPDRTSDHLQQILEFARIRIAKMDAILTPKN